MNASRGWRLTRDKQQISFIALLLFDLKVHKNENFFGSDLSFYYFIVSYAQILRFCNKIFFDQATIGGDVIIPLSLRLSRVEFSLVWD